MNKATKYFVSTMTKLHRFTSKTKAIACAKAEKSGASVFNVCECGCGRMAGKPFLQFSAK